MTHKDRLDEIEQNLKNDKFCQEDIVVYLLTRVRVLTEALEDIETNWVAYKEVVQIARKALEEEE